MSRENTHIEFYRGEEENLPQNRSADAFYVTTDTGKMWLGERRVGVQLEDGLSDNSVQQRGCIAGIKGFYWSAIDVENKIITLSAINDDQGTDVEFSLTEFWAVGDIITIHSGKWWVNCSTIVAVSGTSIEVDSLPFETSTTSTDQAVFVVSKPNNGLVDFGQNAVSFGKNCKSVNFNTFSAGRDNLVYAPYGAAFGRKNIAGYACFVGGQENTVNGSNNLVSGYKNNLEGSNSLVVSTHTTVIGSGNAVFGDHGVSSADENGSVVTGNNNIVSGVYHSVTADYTVVSGGANTVEGRLHLVAGSNNKVIGDTNCVVGEGHVVTGNYIFVSGYQNNITHNECAVLGVGNKTAYLGQTIVGRYNKLNVDALFQVGNGTSLRDDGRGNAFEVLNDGIVVKGVTLTSSQLQKILNFIDTIEG